MATDKPHSGSLFQLTWPLFIDLALHFLTGALNTFMIGRVSYQAVAALAVGNQVFDLSITLFNFVAIGCSVVLTQYLGARDKQTAGRVVHTAIGLNLLVGLLASLGVVLGSSLILRLMNMPAELMAQGHVYLQVIGLCLLPEAAALCLGATLRAHGHTREAMYVTLVVNLVTFLGNLLLLFGFFGLPQLGVAGVAWSTVVGRLVGVAILLWLLPRKTGVRLHWPACFRLQGDLLRQVMRIGLPAAGENLAWMLHFMVITAFVALLGDKMLATQSFYFQISLFVMLFGIAIALGTEIMVGHLVGARKFEQAYRRLLRSLKQGLAGTLVTVGLLWLFGPRLMGLFTQDRTILAAAGQLFLISLLLEPGRTFNIVVISSLRATGDARFPLYMAFVSMWGIAVPLAWFLGIYLEWGLVGIWLAFAVDEWTRGLTMYWRWRSRRWERKVLVAPAAPVPTVAPEVLLG